MKPGVRPCRAIYSDMSRLSHALITATVGLVWGCQAGADPIILSRFGDYHFDGKPRALGENPHEGLDVAGDVGDSVLAAADGIVVRSGQWSLACGAGVVISHPPFGMWTTYCHLSEDSPRQEGPVGRGKVTGNIGRTGTLGASDRSHVHFEVRKADRAPVDPEPYLAGCFDSGKSIRRIVSSSHTQ